MHSLSQVVAGNETKVLLHDLPDVIAESDVPGFLAQYGYKAGYFVECTAHKNLHAPPEGACAGSALDQCPRASVLKVSKSLCRPRVHPNGFQWKDLPALTLHVCGHTKAPRPMRASPEDA